MSASTQNAAIFHMMRLRKAQLNTVHKCRYSLTGSPFGDFSAWLESTPTLPLVIRGEAGQFDRNGNWRRA